MSEHDAPDPMDRAYVEAEAVLSDEAARAARRARVLGAVAGEPAAEAPADVAPPARRSNWGRGGWLAAAGVAGLGVFLASQLYAPVTVQPPAQTTTTTTTTIVTTTTTSPPATAATAAPPPAAAKAPVRAPKPPPPGPAPGPASPPALAKAAPADLAEAAPPPPAPAPLALPAPPPVAMASRAASAAAPAAVPSRSSEINDIVVTGQRIPAPAPRAELRAFAAQKPDQAARLREAAMAGRTGDLTALLDRGVPVDAADDQGETALMKAVQGDHPAAAALLRRHGASPDRKNRAGVSARDMALASGDAELDRALSSGP